jgi:fluoride exporter
VPGRDARPELPLDPDTPSPLAHMRLDAVLWVAAGGIAGTAVRYALALAAPTPTGAWPWATFAVNVAGSFVLGALLEALARSSGPADRLRRIRLFGGTGFCGSLTTYSTFAVEADLLVRDHAAGTAAGYLVASLGAGLAAAGAGIAVAARYRRRQA